ncbi:MAG: O-antigen ligase family protein [Cyanobacteria bacterium P01_G01_bin.19]
MNPSTSYHYHDPHSPPQKLFSGVFLRWQALTDVEKIVCANIVLLPVWWLIGLTNYILLSFALGILAYEWFCHGRLSLKRPSWAVIALFAFYAYDTLDTLMVFLDAYPTIDIPSGSVVTANHVIKSFFPFSIPFLVWYIQSKNIQVRLEVIAWACSVSIIQMFLGWLIFQFAFPSWIDNPPRNLYAILTGKKSFTPGDVGGWTNYLAFYDEDRVRFFFGHYQAAAAFLGFVGLMAVELKNRIWSCLLLAGCIFLLVLIGSRSVWLALPAALLLRFAITLVRLRLTAISLACLAIFSFATLAVTPVTDIIFATYSDTASAVANARAGSTEGRSKVYQATLKKIPEKPLFGYKVLGEPALGGPVVFVAEPPRIGSHSFILGDLMYKKGLLGLGLFTTFWLSLLSWFYQTGRNRPMCWMPILALFTLQSAVTIIQFSMIMGTLLCMLIRSSSQSKAASLTRRHYG